MLRRQALAMIDLGGKVAEAEHHLQEYFLPTADFTELTRDRCDLVLGSKGSGKSALARILCSSDYHVATLNEVDRVPAFTIGGSSFFSTIPDDLAESDLRRIWVAFAVAVLGNHIVRSYDPTPALLELRNALSSADLLAEEILTSKSWWSRLTDTVRDLQPQAGLEFDPLGNPTLTASLAPHSNAYSQQKIPNWFAVDFDPYLLMDPLVAAAKATGRRFWLVLDRLDEAFADRPLLERRALRALLRAHQEVSSHSPAIRIKSFLRSDVFSRITSDEGFVNLDHFESVVLAWDSEMLHEVLNARLRRLELTKYLGMTEDPLKVLLPKKVNVYTPNGRWDVMPVMTWLVQMSQPSSGGPTPRNVLTLLDESIRAAKFRPESVEQEYDPSHPLLTHDDLKTGYNALSRKRLQDTIFAEYATLRPIVERLNGRPMSMDKAYFAEHAGISNDEVDSVLTQLKLAGFLDVVRGRVALSRLYVPALNSYPGVGRLGSLDAASNPQTPREPSSQPPPQLDIQGYLAAKDYDRLADALGSLDALLSAGTAEDVAVSLLGSSLESIPAKLPLLLWRKSSPQKPYSLVGSLWAVALHSEEEPAVVACLSSVSSGGVGPVVNRFLGLSQGRPDDAWRWFSVWYRYLATVHRGRPLVRACGLVWASRVLAIARERENGGASDAITRALIERFWEQVDPSVIRMMHGALWSYAKDVRSVNPPLAPYQVVSIVEVLRSANALSLDLESSVSRALHEQVLDDALRERIKHWAPVSALVRGLGL